MAASRDPLPQPEPRLNQHSPTSARTADPYGSGCSVLGSAGSQNCHSVMGLGAGQLRVSGLKGRRPGDHPAQLLRHTRPSRSSATTDPQTLPHRLVAAALPPGALARFGTISTVPDEMTGAGAAESVRPLELFFDLVFVCVAADTGGRATASGSGIGPVALVTVCR
jgi:hypothetical protein